MTRPLPPVFFSTFLYVARKIVGNARWQATQAAWLAHPDECPWLALQTLHELRHVSEVHVHLASNVSIERSRCIAGGNFLYGAGKGTDVWVTCDDDLFAREDVLRRLVTACRATRGVVAVPYVNRDGLTMCHRRISGPTEWVDTSDDPAEAVRERGIPLRRVDRIGLGLVAMHRTAVERMAQDVASFRDRVSPDALDCPALFRFVMRDGEFIGEDFYFCELAEAADVPMHALLEAPVQHEGVMSKVDLEGAIVVHEPHARRLEHGIRQANADHDACIMQTHDDD